MGDERRRTPVVCDLTDATDTAEARIAEYRRLFDGHLIETAVVNGAVRFRFRSDDGVEVWARDLASREHQCCGFFHFEITTTVDEVRWDTTVADDDAARAMLDEWARFPETVAAGTDEVRDRWTARGLTFVGARHDEHAHRDRSAPG